MDKQLFESLYLIREECEKHIMCVDCPIYNDGCIVEPLPIDWKINIGNGGGVNE